MTLPSFHIFNPKKTSQITFNKSITVGLQDVDTCQCYKYQYTTFPTHGLSYKMHKMKPIRKWNIEKLWRKAFAVLCLSIISYISWQEYSRKIVGRKYRLKGNLNCKMEI